MKYKRISRKCKFEEKSVESQESNTIEDKSLGTYEMEPTGFKKGTLFLVSTPIGNLEDITLRAVRILKEADIIAAEDTRHTIKLLNHFEIKKPLMSYYEHNKMDKGKQIIKLLTQGKNIALVSDAGSPGISDPGEDLVKLCIESNIKVSMAPGPTAAIMGLVLSGLSAGRFVFEGFLPVAAKLRKERILSLKNEARTVIFYEAPHKLLNTLKDLYEILGERRISLARELTKKFEQIERINISGAIKKYSIDVPKGEFVLILEGADSNLLIEENRNEWEKISIEKHMDIYIEKGLDNKSAMKKVAEDRGLSKREIYNRLLQVKD